jgi:glucose-6-phosphate isomerase
MTLPRRLHTRFDPHSGSIAGQPQVARYLSDLRGRFLDAGAYDAALKCNPLVYSVSSFEPDSGAGALHYAIGRIEPGRIGDEYFLTKGHLHTWRSAAELYLGLRGQGLMLLEDEVSGESQAVPLQPDSAVYVPGGTAHRTVNTGDEPLVYLGVYPAEAGHDYGAVAEKNFRKVVLKGAGGPVVLERSDALAALQGRRR